MSSYRCLKERAYTRPRPKTLFQAPFIEIVEKKLVDLFLINPALEDDQEVGLRSGTVGDEFTRPSASAKRANEEADCLARVGSRSHRFLADVALSDLLDVVQRLGLVAEIPRHLRCASVGAVFSKTRYTTGEARMPSLIRRRCPGVALG